MEVLVNLLLGQFLSGLTRAMLLFLVASGLSLIFGVLSVLNFAHGSFYMIGAFIFYEILQILGASGIGFWSSVLLASIAIAAIGAIIEVFIIRRTYTGDPPKDHIVQLLLTFALTLIAGDVVRMAWGGQFYSVAMPSSFAGSVKILGVDFPTYNMFLILFGFAVYAGLWLLIHKTRLGIKIRAAVHDRELVSALGVPIPMLFTAVFAIGIALAGLAGGVFAPLSTISVGMDVSLLIECFAVVIIGGVGRISGTLLGALIVGEVYAFGVLVFPQFAITFVYLVMAIVLIVRPTGILGQKA